MGRTITSFLLLFCSLSVYIDATFFPNPYSGCDPQKGEDHYQEYGYPRSCKDALNHIVVRSIARLYNKSLSGVGIAHDVCKWF